MALRVQDGILGGDPLSCSQRAWGRRSCGRWGSSPRVRTFSSVPVGTAVDASPMKRRCGVAWMSGRFRGFDPGLPGVVPVRFR